MKLYLVGGIIRDLLLGVKSNDYDFSCVLDSDISKISVDEGFKIMENYLKENQYQIFLSTPEMYTIRAKFPIGHKNEGLVADFVLARKEVGYHPGTRRPILELGTLFDDLIRRDFTINAMAEDEKGIIIDPFNGKSDIYNKIIIPPSDPMKSMDDDPLRILRAIRFSITKGFKIDPILSNIMYYYDYDSKMGVVSHERIREELLKCFAFDTILTLKTLDQYPFLKSYIFNNTKLWLKPTIEKR